MTDKQIIRLNDKVLSLSIELSSKLQELACAASERLGYNVIADLCNGAEIEFRDNEVCPFPEREYCEGCGNYIEEEGICAKELAI